MGTAVQTGILVWMSCIIDWDKQVLVLHNGFYYLFILNDNDIRSTCTNHSSSTDISCSETDYPVSLQNATSSP